jgi:hypothetical protein
MGCRTRLLKCLIVLLATALASLGQTATKKTTQPASKPDTWQKSKECAAQAEKAAMAMGFSNGSGWTNHYSPKYNRCFVQFSMPSDSGKTGDLRILLEDAFEKSLLADFDLGAGNCVIFQSETASNCNTVKLFISEHMNN